ncbi:MAG TPA: phosphate/phosphite/phosphonate ABC transporter substrate-binding protein [Pirellulales bacterium]|jgi:phosphonate transport system substrate-binding protein
MSTAPQSNPPAASFSVARVLTLLVLAIVVIGLVYVAKSRQWDQQAREKESTLLSQMGFGASTTMQLDPQFTDADGDLVADAPKDAAQQISPNKLMFAFIGSDTADSERSAWKDLVDALSKRTGKQVEMVAFKNSDDEIQALREGKLQVAGFNTGNVQVAVNTAGLVPFCTLGLDDGSIVSNYSQIIVPAGSPIHVLSDLKGKTITFTDRTSNSGYKAAILLLKDRDLLPQRDYNCRFSDSHEKSIQGIANGDYQAAAVASEMLHRAVANGTVDLTKFQVIETSKPFPPATIGYVYNLSPELAQKIRDTFLDYKWTGTGLEKLFAGARAAKFVPVSYKNDFEWARLIADAVRDPPDVAVLHETQQSQPQ